MREPEEKNSSLIKLPSTGLAKVSKSLQISDKIITRSNQREFELERAHFDSVRIGEQEWMTKNLDVAHFRNGDPIAEIIDNDEWNQAGKNGEPAWCYYENNQLRGNELGKLYNAHAFMDARGLAPVGWRLTEPDDWRNLEHHLWPNHKIHLFDGSWYELHNLDGPIESYRKLETAGFTGISTGYRSSSGEYEEPEIKMAVWWRNVNPENNFYRTTEVYLLVDYYHLMPYSRNSGCAIKCIRTNNA